MAACWAGAKDWMIKRKEHAECQVQGHHLHPEQDETHHGTEEKRKNEEKVFKKRPGIWVQEIPLFIRVKEDLQCNCAETVVWRENGSTEKMPKEQSTKIPLGKFKESYTHGGREELPHRSITSITS